MGSMVLFMNGMDVGRLVEQVSRNEKHRLA